MNHTARLSGKDTALQGWAGLDNIAHYTCITLIYRQKTVRPGFPSTGVLAGSCELDLSGSALCRMVNL